ncbi:MAG: uroporphyrinogen-III synthase [Octadecabacter sp.]
MRIKKPVVLVTRPEVDARLFVERLTDVAGQVETIISPAFTYERRAVDVPAFDVAIFTSKSAVTFAPLGNGRRAYCVGNATAGAAQNAGYDAISADGSADDLISLILRQKPRGVLSHLRGEISRGDVSARLQAAGLVCVDAVLYRKVWLQPAQGIADLDFIDRSVIVPLFSAETVSILAQWPQSFAGCIVVAISDLVAQAARVLEPAQIVVSDRPNMDAMALATVRMIA